MVLVERACTPGASGAAGEARRRAPIPYLPGTPT